MEKTYPLSAIQDSDERQDPYGIPELIEACNIRTDEVHRLKGLLDAQALIIAAARKIVRVHGNGQSKQLDDAVLLLKVAMDEYEQAPNPYMTDTTCSADGKLDGE